VNAFEYPNAKLGEATIRMSLTPDHTAEQLDQLVEAFDWAYRGCKELFEQELSASTCCRVPSAKL
jgi:cysteine sulfinate desulfinase/cysteine desulfurase-like protein